MMLRFTNTGLCLGIFCLLLFGFLEGQQTPSRSDDTKFSIPSQPMFSVASDKTDTRGYWLATDKSLKKGMGNLMKKILPSLMREVYTRNISSDCLSGLLHLTTGLKRTKLWAFEMVDATAKFPEGFLTGTLTGLGDYQECVDINVNESKVKLRGQYCTVTISPPLPEWRPFSSIHLPPPELINISNPDTVLTHILKLLHNLHVVKIKTGACLPSLCSPNDVQNLIQIVPEKIGTDWKFDVHRCELKQDVSFNYTQTVILCVFGVIAFLLTCGSVADVVWDSEKFTSTDIKGTVLQFLVSFSLFSNTRKLGTYKSPYDHLSFVHGIMFFCGCWILISNCFMYANYHTASNFMEALRTTELLFFEIALNRSVPIQTFFYLSGFVAAYKWMKTPEKNPSIWKYILKRYWRYTPTYILMICLFMVSTTWGSGPSWTDQMSAVFDKCYNNWWGNIFYINNFINMEKSCLNHTWVFAVDAQLHILGLVILIPLKRRPTVGLFLNFALIGASLLTVALTNVYYEVPPTEMCAFLDERDRAYYASHTFFRIYTHFCMYCSGIAMGYFIAERPKFTISKKLRFFVWLVVFAAGLGVVCTVHEWHTGRLPTPLTGAIYATFGKVGWAVFLSWMTFVCATGNAGGLNDFLGWMPFAFFARLAFLSYLIHPMLIQITMALKKSHIQVIRFELLYTAMSHIASSYILAYGCYIAFEGPFLSITKVIQTRLRNGVSEFDTQQIANANAACNGVMTEKPMKYADKRKQDDKLKEVNINRTKC